MPFALFVELCLIGLAKGRHIGLSVPSWFVGEVEEEGLVEDPGGVVVDVAAGEANRQVQRASLFRPVVHRVKAKKAKCIAQFIDARDIDETDDEQDIHEFSAAKRKDVYEHVEQCKKVDQRVGPACIQLHIGCNKMEQGELSVLHLSLKREFNSSSLHGQVING